MKSLKQKRKEEEKKDSETILLKIWGNFFKSRNGEFFSFGKSSELSSACGCWFNCGEEEVERLREAILAGNFEAVRQIHRKGRVYRLPGEWIGKEED